MEFKHIKELMTVMRRTGTKRLVIKKEGFELELESQDNGSSKAVESFTDNSDEAYLRQENAFIRAAALSRGRDLAGTPSSSVAPAASQPSEDKAGTYVTSPMVGTFYSSPSPDDPPFVKVGDRIEKHTVVCIVEAMKVMNEVKAGVSGVVTEVLVESAHPVEFGTKLFKVS